MSRTTARGGIWSSLLPIATLGIALVACGRRDIETASPPAPPPADIQITSTPAPVPGGRVPITVADVGLQTPESALHDPVADVYLVSNIHGGPSAKDNNGFISVFAPDGAVRQLRWIEGGRDGVVLHAPKGMAIRGDSLFVTDIDTVRVFHRRTGAAAGAIAVPGSTFLNDLAVAPDGTLYLTDTGIRIGADGVTETGTDAVYRIPRGGAPIAIASGAALQRPNGLVSDGDGVLMVPFGSNEVLRIGGDGTRAVVARLPAGQLDGIVRARDGSLLISSWEGRAIYRVDARGGVEAVVQNVEAPADIGYDAVRNRLLIPLFMANRLQLQPL
jgi:sugar lactone lactonase YvrE